MFRDPIVINNKIMKVLKEILANKDIIQKVRDLHVAKEVQERVEIDELETREDEEIEYMILRNRYFGRSDRDTEKKKMK